MGVNTGDKMLIKASLTPILSIATGTIVKNLNNFGADQSRGEVDTTSFGDKYENFLPGLKKLDMTMAGTLNRSDVGQAILISDYETGNGFYLAVYENSASLEATVYHLFTSKFALKSEANGKQSIDFTFKSVEDPTKIVA